MLDDQNSLWPGQWEDELDDPADDYIDLYLDPPVASYLLWLLCETRAPRRPDDNGKTCSQEIWALAAYPYHRLPLDLRTDLPPIRLRRQAA